MALMDRVKVIHGVCTGCHLMVLTTAIEEIHSNLWSDEER
jgi:hypothetical protein